LKIGLIDDTAMPSERAESEFLGIFREAVTMGLVEVLGSAAAQAAIYYLNPFGREDPRKFHTKLAAIFGAGTPSLESAILEILFERLGLKLVQDGSSFEETVREAERVYAKGATR